MAVARNPWIAHARPSPRARLRLFCFPYAGGGAATYRGWAESLPPEVEVMPVELPGRASRFREAPIRRMAPLIEEMAAGLSQELDRPYALFGHSMGALIAFELARHLRRLGAGGPLWVFASARRAPHVPHDDPIHDLPEPRFVSRLRDLNGTPEEVLQHPELMQMMIPILRADFELNETYEFEPDEPLACPLTALGGLADEDVGREDLERWRQHTAGPFAVRMFSGDHFYLESDRRELLTALARDLAVLAADL